jgi:hypothetical protein
MIWFNHLTTITKYLDYYKLIMFSHTEEDLGEEIIYLP